jgi:transposase
VRADGALEERFVHLVSVKGIAQASAITLLAELSVLPADMSARQWVAYAGLDPKHSESGTSVTGAVRISKVGNRHLRAALFPALPPRCRLRSNEVLFGRMRPLHRRNGPTCWIPSGSA